MKKEKLKRMVNTGMTHREIAKEVGMTRSGVQYWLGKHELSTKGSKKSWTSEQLREAVLLSKTKSGVLRKLGLKVCGGNFRTLDKYLIKLDLDIEHFTGCGHGNGGKRLSDDEVFVKGSTYKTSLLYDRLLDLGWEEKCKKCGLTAKWNSKPLRLHVDHINGDHSDHRLENLRLLCPNCHSQTETYCGRNK